MGIGTSAGEYFDSETDLAYDGVQSASQKSIDELVAAAPNFANSSVIDQMTATAERSRPELPTMAEADRIANKKKLTKEEINRLNAEADRRNFERYNPHNVPRDFLPPNAVLEGERDITDKHGLRNLGAYHIDEVREQMKHEVLPFKGMDKDQKMPRLGIQPVPSIPENSPAWREQILQDEYWNQRARERKGDKPLLNMSQSDEQPYPSEVMSGQQYAMMRLKDVPSNPGVEAEKLAGATAVARGGSGSVKLQRTMEQEPFGTYQYSIQSAEGKHIASASISRSDNGRDIYVNTIGGKEGPGSLGTKDMRNIVRQLKAEFPDAERLYGFRVSGARGKAGTNAEGGVNLKPRSEWKDPEARGIPQNPGRLETMTDAEFDQLIRGMQDWRNAPNLHNNLGRVLDRTPRQSNEDFERALRAVEEVLRTVN